MDEASGALAPVMTVMGREYTLVDPEESPPRWWVNAPEHTITLWGYPDMWKAIATVNQSDAYITLFGNGPTPEAALESLTAAYGQIDAQRVRMLDLIEGALGTAPGAEVAA